MMSLRQRPEMMRSSISSSRFRAHRVEIVGAAFPAGSSSPVFSLADIGSGLRLLARWVVREEESGERPGGEKRG